MVIETMDIIDTTALYCAFKKEGKSYSQKDIDGSVGARKFSTGENYSGFFNV